MRRCPGAALFNTLLLLNKLLLLLTVCDPLT